MDLIQKLGINWSLLLAQAVNFFLILGVLLYLVYKPILKVLDERSERIRAAMDDAAKIESQKRDMEEARRKNLSKVDREAGEIMSQARLQAEKKHAEIVKQAHAEAADIVSKGRALVAAERLKAYEDVKRELASMIVRLTQKVLEREFTPADQKRLIASLEKEIPKQSR